MKGIINGRIIVENEQGKFSILDNHVLIFDKKIIQIAAVSDFMTEQIDEIIDAKGLFVSPGFINTHIHGCGGFDTMDSTIEGLTTIAQVQARTGVTAFLPTTMTYDMPNIYKALDCIHTYMAEKNKEGLGAKVIGCHMEGPFINTNYKGAQAAKDIQKPNFSLIEKYAAIVKVITVAPEVIPENNDFAEKCVANNIILSIGHSAADFDIAYKAITEQGFSRFTHLFNAMTGLHHRKPGAVGAAMNTEAFTELILDNIHIHPAMQNLVWQVKGPEKLVAITDSMRACGLGDGESELGGQKVFVTGNLATLQDGTIAGSVATMDNCIKNLANSVNRPVYEAVQCATKTVAKSINMENEIGSLKVGNAADIVLFDDNVDIKLTIVDGKTVYAK